MEGWGEAGRGSSWRRRGLIRACPSDEREAVQKKTFTKWVNSHLARVGCHIGDLYADLRDGFVLTRLLEVLSGEQLVRGPEGLGKGGGPSVSGWTTAGLANGWMERPRKAGWVKGTSFGWAGLMAQGWSLVVRSLGVWLGTETGFRQRGLPFGTLGLSGAPLEGVGLLEKGGALLEGTGLGMQ